MGQYHEIYNLDRKLYYSPRDIGSNVKILEFGEDLIPTALMIYLLEGEWKNDRVCVIGDYAEDGDIQGVSKKEFENIDFTSFAIQAREILEDITNVKFVKDYWEFNGDKIETIKIDCDGELAVKAFTNYPGLFAFVNYDKQEKFVFSEVSDEYNGVVRSNNGTLYDACEDGFQSGLSVAMIGLIAGSIKNGPRGGGDVDLRDYGASWCGDHVGIERVEDVSEYTNITGDVLDIMHETMDAHEFWFLDKWMQEEKSQTSS